jgi:CheY-like chemotaxis protein
MNRQLDLHCFMLIVNVDDDVDDREFFSDALKSVDPMIPCVLFENGPELLDYLENTKLLPDYIFLDINMPKMNGYECAQEIKSNYRSEDIQIVMYSTAFNPLDLEKFDRDGFKYVVKQSTLPDLVRSIRKVIIPSPALINRRAGIR